MFTDGEECDGLQECVGIPRLREGRVWLQLLSRKCGIEVGASVRRINRAFKQSERLEETVWRCTGDNSRRQRSYGSDVTPRGLVVGNLGRWREVAIAEREWLTPDSAFVAVADFHALLTCQCCASVGCFLVYGRRCFNT